MMNLKKLLTNKFAEKFLVGTILLFRSKNWVYRFVPSNTDYKVGSIRIAKRRGFKYQLDLSDYQEWLVYFYCNTDSSDYVLNYLAESEIILDIGANIGQTSFNMLSTQKSKKIKPIIFAFEPYPKTYRKLETNITLNKSSEIKVYNLGLSQTKGMLNMTQHSPLNSGGFRITQDSVNSISVPVISIDDFVSENQIRSIDFIKIDVEGFEEQVIKGAIKTIETFNPILVFEYSSINIQEQGGNIEELLKLLSLTYNITTKEGISDKKTILNINYQTDLICIPL